MTLRYYFFILAIFYLSFEKLADAAETSLCKLLTGSTLTFSKPVVIQKGNGGVVLTNGAIEQAGPKGATIKEGTEYCYLIDLIGDSEKGDIALSANTPFTINSKPPQGFGKKICEDYPTHNSLRLLLTSADGRFSLLCSNGTTDFSLQELATAFGDKDIKLKPFVKIVDKQNSNDENFADH